MSRAKLKSTKYVHVPAASQQTLEAFTKLVTRSSLDNAEVSKLVSQISVFMQRKTKELAKERLNSNRDASRSSRTDSHYWESFTIQVASPTKTDQSFVGVNYKIFIWNRHPMAPMLEDGKTRVPYPITPRKGKIMKWPADNISPQGSKPEIRAKKVMWRGDGENSIEAMTGGAYGALSGFHVIRDTMMLTEEYATNLGFHLPVGESKRQYSGSGRKYGRPGNRNPFHAGEQVHLAGTPLGRPQTGRTKRR